MTPPPRPSIAVHDAQAALRLWRTVTAAMMDVDALDMTPRQLAILLAVYLEPGPHTIRGLAEGVGVSKPAVCRALDALGEAGLVKRRKDPDDGRSVLVQRTVQGAVLLNGLGERIVASAHEVGR